MGLMVATDTGWEQLGFIELSFDKVRKRRCSVIVLGQSYHTGKCEAGEGRALPICDNQFSLLG